MTVPISPSISNASASSSTTDSLAREFLHLNSLKDGLRRETESLKRADNVRLLSLESEIKKLEQLRQRQATELDSAELELQSLQQKAKTVGNGGTMESSVREIRRELSSFLEQGLSGDLGPKKERKSSESTLSRFLLAVEEARFVLKRSSEIRDEARGFSLVDGESVQGRVKRIGETAAIGIAEGKMAPLSPDGKGGWIAMRPLQEKLSSFVIFSNVSERIESGLNATIGDHALGLIPLVWLGLLGVAVTWLFALIAKN